MSDDKLIRLSDAIAALRSADLPFGYGHAAEVIRTIPAAQPSPDVAALVALMPEVIASLDATDCNISLVRDLHTALARVKGGAA